MRKFSRLCGDRQPTIGQTHFTFDQASVALKLLGAGYASYRALFALKNSKYNARLGTAVNA